MKLYLLIKRNADGTVTWKLGGGSSTAAAPRMYADREQAERQAKRMAGRKTYAPIPDGIEIIEIPVSFDETAHGGSALLQAEDVLHGLGRPFWGLASAVAEVANAKKCRCHLEAGDSECDVHPGEA